MKISLLIFLYLAFVGNHQSAQVQARRVAHPKQQSCLDNILTGHGKIPRAIAEGIVCRGTELPAEIKAVIAKTAQRRYSEYSLLVMLQVKNDETPHSQIYQEYILTPSKDESGKSYEFHSTVRSRRGLDFYQESR